MRAIRIAKPGGPQGLKLVDLPEPVPSAGQVLVKVAAVGVNFIDTYRRSGVYKVDFPHVPGTEGAGTVAALGEGVTGPEIGQKVAWADSVTGSYAEFALVEASRLLPVPPSVPLEVAAAVPLQGMTADYLIRSTYPVKAGEFVLLYAAAGGVGQLATQMALMAGAEVIATVGRAAKAASVIALGVPPDRVIDLGALTEVTEDLPPLVKALSGGPGAHVAYDGIGRDTFQATLASLRPRGMAVLYGGASGQVPPFDPQELNAHGSLYLTRPKLGDYTATAAELRQRGERVFGEIAAGQLKVSIGHEYRLASADQAHAALESGSTRGKAILIP